MDIQTFIVEHTPTDANIIVKIDFDFVHPQLGSVENTMTEVVNFWVGAEDKIKQNDGSVLNTFLKMLCAEVLHEAAANFYNVSGVIDVFKEKEGFCDIDGSFGIRLTGINKIDLSCQSDFEITKMPGHEKRG